MLEVKNLSKTYKTKKGIEVKALDDVSLLFPDTGMIFILGKSGSGKSTLLNCLGGLDKFDDGEIIINGKSSKAFSQSDFDSYRNTYLGFIFQEYNILDEFSVGANIGLAMELQGKKASSEEINAIMEEVDLVGYANRKPNELSGGQKQRVAIARALVKNPEMIMADEPTGALDSNTGIQVFDTLKKLSQTKLVLVVSHDRDFAERYGDRVIELADGKIISDITKYDSEGKALSNGMTIIDDKVIQIKSGYNLTDDDLRLIKNYINKANGNTLISLDSKVNTSVCQSARIDEEGNKESFTNTTKELIPTSIRNDFNLIKSRLKSRHALKMGASSLKVKPIRLFITILLSFVAFAMFGLANTMGSYKKIDAAVNSIKDENVKNISLTKETLSGSGDDKYYNSKKLSDDDIEELSDKFDIDFKGVYDFNVGFSNNYDDQSLISNSKYYKNYTYGAYELTNNCVEKNNFSLIGNVPANDKEIVITKYQYEMFKTAGYRTKDSSIIIKPTELTEEGTKGIIGKSININDDVFKIVGILDTKLDTENYQSLKDESSGGISDYMKQEEFSQEVCYGFHNLFYVNSGYIARNSKISSNYEHTNYNSIYYNNSNVGGFSSQYVSCSNVFDDDSGTIMYINGKSSVGKNEIAISYDTMLGVIGYDTLQTIKLSDSDKIKYNLDYDGASLDSLIYSDAYYRYSDAFIDYVNNNYTNFDPASSSLTVEERKNYYITYLLNGDTSQPSGYYDDEYGDKSGYEFKHLAQMELIEKFDLLEKVNSITINSSRYDQDNSQNIEKSVHIVGVFFNGIIPQNYDDENKMNNIYSNLVIIEQEIYDYYKELSSYVYNFAIATMPSSKSDIRKIVKAVYADDDADINYSLNNAVQSALDNVNSLISSLSKVFLYVGIGFAVFASLMLFNFISISISYKKREIGILRAVGARSKDVFRIFFDEALIITLINFVLATITASLVCSFLNNYVRNDYGLPITILNFGFIQIALILVISIGVALLSSAFPVYTIARKRPIDAIKNR